MGLEEVKFCVVKPDSKNSMIQKGNKFFVKEGTTHDGIVTLKLERPIIVHTIRLTNNKSAFLEVLAAPEKVCSQFNVLVPVLPILSPENSKTLKKCDRSIEIKRDHFTGSNRSKALDYIQIVCSQPFNKNTVFGFEDVHIFGKEPKNESHISKDVKSKMGKFEYYSDDKLNRKTNLFDSYDMDYKKSLMRLYEKKPKSDADTAGNDDDKNNEKNDDDKKRKHSGKSEEKGSVKKSKKDTENDFSSKAENKKSHSSSDSGPKSSSTVKQKHAKTEIADEPNEKQSVGRKTIIKQETSDESDNTLKAKASSSSKKCNILSGVVFVLSGYENPQRSQLRDIAVSMGAHYQSKWDEHCTHLISAFSNTPKYNDAQRSNGRIVTGKWILDCHKNGKLLKWQNYELKSDDTSPEKESKATAATSKAVLAQKESQDNNDNSGRMIDTNGKHNPNTDKDRKRKAVKREREPDSEQRSDNHHGNDDDDHDDDGDRDRERHSKRKKTKKEHLNPTKMNSKADKPKMYARECDSDVIYEQDTEDELS